MNDREYDPKRNVRAAWVEKLLVPPPGTDDDYESPDLPPAA